MYSSSELSVNTPLRTSPFWPRFRWTVGLRVALLLLSPGVLLVGCNQIPTERNAAEVSYDNEIIGHVRAALDQSTDFKYPDVQILCFRGTVQLTGFVISTDQKKAAAQIAKSVPGVRDVQNKITVRSS